MHFRFRFLYMGHGWSHLSGGYWQEDQGLHQGDMVEKNSSSEEKEKTFWSEKTIRIKAHMCEFQEMINVFKCYRGQIKELKGLY